MSRKKRECLFLSCVKSLTQLHLLILLESNFYCTRVLLCRRPQSGVGGWGKEKSENKNQNKPLIFSGNEEVKHMSLMDLNIYFPGICNYVI